MTWREASLIVGCSQVPWVSDSAWDGMRSAHTQQRHLPVSPDLQAPSPLRCQPHDLCPGREALPECAGPAAWRTYGLFFPEVTAGNSQATLPSVASSDIAYCSQVQ